MLLKQVLEVFEVLDTPKASGSRICNYLQSLLTDINLNDNDSHLRVDESSDYDLCVSDGEVSIAYQTIANPSNPSAKTDFIRVMIAGTHGKSQGGDAPTIGVIGRLGGLGARPARIGFVSDGDGALAALAVAAKLINMKVQGDRLAGDVIITTHVCPDAPTMPHEPVPFMGSPLDMATLNSHEVDKTCDALLCVDTTKGNLICNHRGFAISPTVRDGYILKTSPDLLQIMQTTTGQLPRVFALAQQDITPYSNGLVHLNSILQPATATDKPTVGVAITTETAVAGCATGATHAADVEEAARFILEVAKEFTAGRCAFCDEDEYGQLLALYGSMSHFRRG